MTVEVVFSIFLPAQLRTVVICWLDRSSHGGNMVHMRIYMVQVT
jgi:hypothetical protein